MKLKELCTPDVVSCTAEINALHAARLMRDHHVGDLVILDDSSEDGTPIGIVTDRDLAVRALAGAPDPSGLKARDVMSRDVICCYAGEDAHRALAAPGWMPRG